MRSGAPPAHDVSKVVKSLSVGGICTIMWAAKRARVCRNFFERCREFSLSALLAVSYWPLARPFNHLITTFTAISTHMGEVIDFDDSRPL